MNEKILVVEDDLILRKAITIALVDANFEVVEALDGEEGLRKATIEKPDLILLDLILPKKSGWHVLESLKKTEETKNIPVLVLTVVPTEESISKCMKLGAQGYFIKSEYSLEEIIKKVRMELI